MSRFDYRRPGTVVEATELLAGDDAVALAGGTDLMVSIRHRKIDPGLVVDLKSVADLSTEIEIADDGVVIGARVVMTDIVVNRHIQESYPALVSAASVVGSVQIRNRATLAGNLCNASPAADTIPALLAYDAAVTVSNGDETRSMPLQQFFVGPGITALRRGEILTAVTIPVPVPGSGSAFARVTRRRGVDLASVNLACLVEPSGRARYGLGAVGPTPVLAESTVDEIATDDGLERLLEGTDPISDVRAGADYRRAMLRIHVRRALAVARRAMGSP